MVGLGEGTFEVVPFGEVTLREGIFGLVRFDDLCLTGRLNAPFCLEWWEPILAG